MSSKQFAPEVPFVFGLLLNQSRAVIHALPICQIENNDFVPRFTLFLMSYFSEQPQKTYHSMVVAASAVSGAEGYATNFRVPVPNREEDWWDLRRWVATGQLFWVDANDPNLPLRTHDIDAFPYGNIIGRKTTRSF
jgi:hypothetical protein